MGKCVIDVNCDMGEGFGYWRLGETEDAELMRYISSANIATGFHAGDPNMMDKSVQLAIEHGVRIGAHPGYADLQGFGRRKIETPTPEIINDIVYQVGALREFARRYDVPLQHVKPHGALYMEMATNEELSEQFVEFMRTSAPDSFIFCMDISTTYRAAVAAGQPVIREFFADRHYDNTGSIIFTRQMERLSPSAVAEKVIKACQDGTVRTVDGEDIFIEFDSICFHSDTPGCGEIAKSMYAALKENNIRIESVSETHSATTNTVAMGG